MEVAVHDAAVGQTARRDFGPVAQAVAASYRGPVSQQLGCCLTEKVAFEMFRRKPRARRLTGPEAGQREISRHSLIDRMQLDRLASASRVAEYSITSRLDAARRVEGFLTSHRNGVLVNFFHWIDIGFQLG